MADKLEEMQRKVAEWADSPRGKAELEETARTAKAAGQKVLDDARVEPEQLRRPMTI